MRMLMEAALAASPPGALMSCAGHGPVGHIKSTVPKLCRDIDERINAVLERRLDGDWPYLWMDVTYLKQRHGGRIVSVIIAVSSR